MITEKKIQEMNQEEVNQDVADEVSKLIPEVR